MSTTRRDSLRRTETETHERLVVVTESQARVRLDQLFDPFEICRRREFDQVLQRQRRVRDDWFVAAVGDVLLQKRVEKLDRRADRGGLVTRKCKIDRDDFGTLIEDLIVGLAQEFRNTG